MIFRRAILLVVLVVLTSATAFGAGALMGRYDPCQTSYTPEKLEPPLALLWEYTANKYENNPAPPAVADGVCYFACGDRVYAVDTSTGSLKWKYPSDQRLGGYVKASPAVHDGNVYFGAGDGNLYCVNAATGAFQWAYQTRGAIRCPPVISDNDMIYVGADDNSLYAIDAGSGDAKWSFTGRDDIAVGVAVGTGMAVVSCMDGNMYGINANSGKLRWIQRLPLAPTRTSPVISQNIVVMAVGSQMFGLSLRSGRLRWAVRLPAEAAASPAVDGSDIYVPCRNKMIYAYTSVGRNLSLKWTEPAELGSMPMSSPTIAQNVLYITGSKGVIAAFSAVDGNLKWRYLTTPSAVTTPSSLYTDAASSPIVAEGSLFVLTDDGVLHRFTQDAPDNAVPTVFRMAPTNGIAMSGAPPIKMSAVLYDIGSGVDFFTAALYLDGQSTEREVDILASSISFQTKAGTADKAVTALKDGVHTITVTAKDYKGNLLKREWYFLADSSLPPPRRIKPAAAPGKKVKEPPQRTRPTPRPAPQPTPQPGGPERPPPPPPPPAGMRPGAPPGAGGPYGPGPAGPPPGGPPPVVIIR